VRFCRTRQGRNLRAGTAPSAVLDSKGRIKTMRRLMLKSLSPFVATVTMLMGTFAYARQEAQPEKRNQAAIQRRIPEAARIGSVLFVRTELFFGTARQGGAVTDAEFKDFVDNDVTPRFPDGLTLLKGDGQLRGSDDVVIKERSYVLILLYPFESLKEGNTEIEEIRRIYKRKFSQESVLRVDDPFLVWVSF
jgi:Protein of unknown function (DUF3574)